MMFSAFCLALLGYFNLVRCSASSAFGKKDMSGSNAMAAPPLMAGPDGMENPHHITWQEVQFVENSHRWMCEGLKTDLFLLGEHVVSKTTPVECFASEESRSVLPAKLAVGRHSVRCAV
eukprot:6021521-Amphidinium_carterae.1